MAMVPMFSEALVANLQLSKGEEKKRVDAQMSFLSKSKYSTKTNVTVVAEVFR